MMGLLLKTFLLLVLSTALPVIGAEQTNREQHDLEEDGDQSQEAATERNDYCSEIENYASEKGLLPFEAGLAIATLLLHELQPKFGPEVVEILCIDGMVATTRSDKDFWNEFTMGFRAGTSHTRLPPGVAAPLPPGAAAPSIGARLPPGAAAPSIGARLPPRAAASSIGARLPPGAAAPLPPGAAALSIGARLPPGAAAPLPPGVAAPLPPGVAAPSVGDRELQTGLPLGPSIREGGLRALIQVLRDFPLPPGIHASPLDQ